MTPFLPVLIPALGAAAAKATRGGSVPVLLAVALLDAALATFLAVAGPADKAVLLGGYLAVDPTSRLFLALVNLIFLGIAAYVWSRARQVPELKEDVERFVGLSLLFMAAANLAILSNHLLAMWICLEVTTLAAAPLIIRAGAPSTLQASWRYFLFSSVGLGLTLLGFACLSHGIARTGAHPSFFVDQLGEKLQGPADLWQRLGLGLIFLGYGTKLGLAPMYSWLPETYDESSPAVTALLAAVQFNCALVAVFRVLQVSRGVDQSWVSAELLGMGLLSMGVSSFNIIATRNYKRLIAYASINHGGVIAIGLGIGRSATYGLLLYVVSNAFIKTILFLTAGKILSHYKTKDMREVAGLIKDLPYSGLFLMVGTFALLGFPPFGSFLGELMILSGLIRGGYVLVFVSFCVLLTITFVATGRSVFPMIWGEPKAKVTWPPQSAAAVGPKLLFLAALVAMGLYLPPPVSALFRQVASSLGGE